MRKKGIQSFEFLCSAQVVCADVAKPKLCAFSYSLSLPDADEIVTRTNQSEHYLKNIENQSKLGGSNQFLWGAL